MHPTQIPMVNSSKAKKIKTPEITIAARGKLKMLRMVIANVIRKPRRAANIFGALSMGLLLRFKALARDILK